MEGDGIDSMSGAEIIWTNCDMVSACMALANISFSFSLVASDNFFKDTPLPTK